MLSILAQIFAMVLSGAVRLHAIGRALDFPGEGREFQAKYDQKLEENTRWMNTYWQQYEEKIM